MTDCFFKIIVGTILNNKAIGEVGISKNANGDDSKESPSVHH